MLVSAATAYSDQVCNTESGSYLGLRPGVVVLLVGARLGGERLVDVDTAFVGMVHGRPTVEAPLVGKLSRDASLLGQSYG